jgi:hypothetical protein
MWFVTNRAVGPNPDTAANFEKFAAYRNQNGDKTVSQEPKKINLNGASSRKGELSR